jgi:hypothetical protein
MPPRDIYHHAVTQALLKDGWTITHDPFPIYYGTRRGYIDIGAEQRTLAAEKGTRKIAVEVKSFVGDSIMADLEQAVGQYLVYRSWLTRIEPERELFLAIGESVAADVFDEPAGRVLVEDYQLRLVVVATEREEVVQWIR